MNQNKNFNYTRTTSSAEVIVPIILKLIRPKSVIDVGCGEGYWLSVFNKNGIKNVVGIDDPNSNIENLQITPDQFIALDLRNPKIIKGKYDLAISLEVAEHLPKTSAVKFINFLTNISDVVMFSAAIPNQGGYKHINEQWQNYWNEKFKKHDYIAVDCIRSKVWNNEKVLSWYAQNCILYVKKGTLNKYPLLKIEIENSKNVPISLVHPKIYAEKLQSINRIRKYVRLIPFLKKPTT